MLCRSYDVGTVSIADAGEADLFRIGTIIMRNLIFYTIAGSAIGLAAQAAGLDLPMVIGLSLLVPPALIIAWIVLKSRGIARRTRNDYWQGKARR
jgi:hypothetical protein